MSEKGSKDSITVFGRAPASHSILVEQFAENQSASSVKGQEVWWFYPTSTSYCCDVIEIESLSETIHALKTRPFSIGAIINMRIKKPVEGAQGLL